MIILRVCRLTQNNFTQVSTENHFIKSKQLLSLRTIKPITIDKRSSCPRLITKKLKPNIIKSDQIKKELDIGLKSS